MTKRDERAIPNEPRRLGAEPSAEATATAEWLSPDDAVLDEDDDARAPAAPSPRRRA